MSVMPIYRRSALHGLRRACKLQVDAQRCTIGPALLRPQSFSTSRRASAVSSNANAVRAAPQDDWKKQVLDDAQGDIAIGLPKNKEAFFFFTVQDVGKFKSGLASLDVANGSAVLKKKEEIRAAPKGRLVKAPFLNIAFSSKGLAKLGLPDLDKLEDPGPLKSKFKNGQLASAESLGDSGKTVSGKFDPDWEAAFKSPLDGLILIAAESEASIAEKREHYRTVFGDSLREEYTLKGTVRPGENRGHEHFGWLDDISNPAITGLGVDGKGSIIKGQTELDPGVLLCSQKGDSKSDRPAWAKNGSFLVFRQLAQKVPEFHQFLVVTAATALNDPSPQGAHRLGAHLVGRWKSGAPLLLAPKEDNEKLGKDKDKNNVFTFPTGTGDEGQALCPYSAHIRKTNPRNDITPAEVRNHSIRRAGITYGPEVSSSEEAEKVTKQQRGLAFVCYQSDLADGFDFMQRLWCNNSAFPFQKKVKPDPGLDPLIGQKVVDGKRDRATWGTTQGSKISSMPEFVNSRGGEYFFSPSLSTLKNVIAKK